MGNVTEATSPTSGKLRRVTYEWVFEKLMGTDGIRGKVGEKDGEAPPVSSSTSPSLSLSPV